MCDSNVATALALRSTRSCARIAAVEAHHAALRSASHSSMKTEIGSNFASLGSPRSRLGFAGHFLLLIAGLNALWMSLSRRLLLVHIRPAGANLLDRSTMRPRRVGTAWPKEKQGPVHRSPWTRNQKLPFSGAEIGRTSVFAIQHLIHEARTTPKSGVGDSGEIVGTSSSSAVGGWPSSWAKWTTAPTRGTACSARLRTLARRANHEMRAEAGTAATLKHARPTIADSGAIAMLLRFNAIARAINETAAMPAESATCPRTANMSSLGSAAANVLGGPEETG